ncbi:MAG: outer membrane beta-barrel protein [Bacteroidales bacterium]|nr:outer membrane beta-barrel protein [Bacteroidales bacterium]
MKKLLLPLLAIFILNFAQAQFCEISGSLVDANSGESLAYGNISVLDKNDSIVSGGITNLKGEFRIRYLNCNEQYKLQINYTGFALKLIELPEKISEIYDVGEIKLEYIATELKEATIEGEVQVVEQKFDRKIYNISETKVMAAKDIFDLLRTLPGVTVDEEGNVKYKGMAATIYVDDMPAQYIYPKIEMIPIAQVIKIEVIDAALKTGSSKGGIINIKMKSMASDGLSGMMKADSRTTSFKSIDDASGFANLNYKKGSWLVFANANYSHGSLWAENKSEGKIFIGDKIFEEASNGNYNYLSDMLWTYGGVSYMPSIDTRMYFSLGNFLMNSLYTGSHQNATNLKGTETYVEKYSQSNEDKYNYTNAWLSFYFYHKIDSVGKEISVYAGLNGNNNRSTENNSYKYAYQNSSVSNNKQFFLNEELSNSMGMWAGAFYNHPFNEYSRWNIGYNIWTPFYENSENSFYINDVDYLPNSGKTNAKTLSQSISSRYGTTYKKWKFDAGASFEHNRNNIDFLRYNEVSQDTSFVFKKDYFNIVPSANIIFSVDSLNDIKLTYSQSVQTPYQWQVCDFIEKKDPYVWRSGNSNLNPVRYHNIYLGYMINQSMWNFNLDLFYSYTNKEIDYLFIPINEVILLGMPQNLNKKSNLGIDISAYYSIKSKVDLHFSSSIFHTIIDAENLNDDLIKKDFGYYVKLSSDIRFTKRSSANIFVNYHSREISISGYSFGYINSSISFNQRFLRNSLICSVGVNGILNNLLDHGSFTDYAGRVYTSYKYGSQYMPKFFVSLQYNFRQGDRGTQQMGKM